MCWDYKFITKNTKVEYSHGPYFNQRRRQGYFIQSLVAVNQHVNHQPDLMYLTTVTRVEWHLYLPVNWFLFAPVQIHKKRTKSCNPVRPMLKCPKLSCKQCSMKTWLQIQILKMKMRQQIFMLNHEIFEICLENHWL